MWVQLRAIKQIQTNGKARQYYPGDWVDIGKQQALAWIDQGDAWVPDLTASKLDSDEWTLCIIGSDSPRLGIIAKAVTIEHRDDPALLGAKTLIWNMTAKLRTEFLSVGFMLLDKFQIALPLLDYETLAADIGSDADRELTRSVVRDLRVLLYDPRVLFARRCSDGETLLERFSFEQERGDGDDRLALLRALYTVKPTICALPASWVKT